MKEGRWKGETKGRREKSRKINRRKEWMEIESKERRLERKTVREEGRNGRSEKGRKRGSNEGSSVEVKKGRKIERKQGRKIKGKKGKKVVIQKGTVERGRDESEKEKGKKEGKVG